MLTVSRPCRRGVGPGTGSLGPGATQPDLCVGDNAEMVFRPEMTVSSAWLYLGGPGNSVLPSLAGWCLVPRYGGDLRV